MGKDFLARLLRHELSHRGLRAGISHFAKAMKAHVHALFGRYGVMAGDAYEKYPNLKSDPISALGGRSARDIWIAYGNVIRTIYNDVWVDGMFLPPCGLDVQIIPDLRFPNEAQAIVDRGGILIKVSSPLVPGEDDGADDALSAFTGWTHEVVNDFKPKTLQRAAEDIADAIEEIVK